MTKKAILFVDDEANILRGLKRMLHSMRKEIVFYFAESGQDALDLLAEKEVNVVVSDMRMPGMDGGVLLTKVKEKYPHIIRIMLTGHADNESVYRTVPVVHQFLAKPSDPDTLKMVFSRACALQQLVASEQLKTLVAGLGTLPSLPDVYLELQEKTKDPDCSIADFAAIVEKDLAMSTKVLQLVNSAFYGFYTKVESPARAVTLLGLDTLKSLVLGIGVFTEMSPTATADFSLAALWEHSITTANFAKKIAQDVSEDETVIENSFIAGIVHDIGKLLLLSSLGDQFLKAVGIARTTPVVLSEGERQVFDADHSDVGGYLLGLWGLPGNVVEAVTFHHKLDTYPEASFCPALAVHAADVIFYMLNPEACVGLPPVLSKSFLEKAGLADRFAHWVEVCKEVQMKGEQDD